MLTQQVYLSVNQYSDRQNKAVNRILESLGKSESRLGDHYKTSRSHSRKTCNTIVEVRILREEQEPITFTAYMGDISSTGMSFIFPETIFETSIIVGIPIKGRETVWFKGEIVRVKGIPTEEFSEYGVKFNGRLM